MVQRRENISMKRKLAVLAMTAVLGLSAVACGSEPAKE